MDLFVIQPTYALHSLLRPNRSREATSTVEVHAKPGRDKHPVAVEPAGAEREMCAA